MNADSSKARVVVMPRPTPKTEEGLRGENNFEVGLQTNVEGMSDFPVKRFVCIRNWGGFYSKGPVGRKDLAFDYMW